jgi:hypothetical protein
MGTLNHARETPNPQGIRASASRFGKFLAEEAKAGRRGAVIRLGRDNPRNARLFLLHQRRGADEDLPDRFEQTALSR